MTADEFERAYAARSGVTVDELREYRTVRPCACGEDGCEGWQSISHERAAEWDAANMPTAIRCKWEVTAGLIPGEDDGQWHREWTLTAAQWGTEQRHRHFGELQSAALTYVSELQFKGATGRAPINWVHWSFVWY